MSDAHAHYDRLASMYDENWAFGQEFHAWMSGCLRELLQLRLGDRVADVGCGTGLYSAPLLELASSVTCVDPSKKMLEQIPDDQRLVRVHASAEDVASGRVSLPENVYEAIFLKEAIHHVSDRDMVMRGLRELLAPAARLVVAMLPTMIDYPLFRAAHERFQALQPDPEWIAESMRQAGLAAEVTYHEFPLSFPTERYLQMVHNRYMSLLSQFSDVELAAGIEEIRRKHPGETVEFVDRFAFVTGSAS